jgi:hypothetical protein
LSIEYPLLERDFGSGACPPAAFVRAIEALGSPALRIGGDSQDEVAPSGSAPAAGVSDLAPGFWGQLACLERDTGIPVVVGLNLAWGRTSWAVRMAAAARAAVPRSRLSFELGNEPDIYGVPVKWWNGRAVVAARMPWTTYLTRVRALAAALGHGTALEGPDFASGRWVDGVAVVAATANLQTIDAHFYPIDGCIDPSEETTANLLSRQIQDKLDERIRLALDARKLGLAAVISEANSISCGGHSGASDQPAAAVWAVRMMLRAVRFGFSSVRFHSSGGAYDPFVVDGGAIVTRPLGLGLRAAAGLLAPGARLRAIANASSLDAVAITRPGGTATTVVSNYGSRPRWVGISSGASASVLSVIARVPTVTSRRVAAAGGLLLVELPPNSVDAITTARRG